MAIPRWFRSAASLTGCTPVSADADADLMSVHPLVRLAGDAIGLFLSTRQMMAPPPDLLAAMPQASRPGAAFVCLKIKGQLRGCIGTIRPVQDALAREVIHNAVAAATRDPRFDPVHSWETERLSIIVDVLGTSEPIEGPEQLDPTRFGLVVRAGPRQGVLLPGIEEIRTAAEQLAAACDKAGIQRDEPMELFRFMVTRYR